MQHPCSVEYWSTGAYSKILHDYCQTLVVGCKMHKDGVESVGFGRTPRARLA